MTTPITSSIEMSIRSNSLSNTLPTPSDEAKAKGVARSNFRWSLKWHKLEPGAILYAPIFIGLGLVIMSLAFTLHSGPLSSGAFIYYGSGGSIIAATLLLLSVRSIEIVKKEKEETSE